MDLSGPDVYPVTVPSAVFSSYRILIIIIVMMMMMMMVMMMMMI